MRKSVIALMALGLAGGLGYVLLSPGSGSGGNASAQGAGNGSPRAPAVEIARARGEEARVELRGVGSLASDESILLAPEVAGRIAAIDFTEGAPVKRGDVLVKLDEALARADLTDAQARLKLAEANFARASSLSQSGIGTTRARDEATANLATARAAEELAAVRLDKISIRAPFDGVMGLRQASVGAYIQAGATIVNLEKIDTLKVDFRLPEINLADVAVRQKVAIRVDALPGRSFEGEIYAIDPQVDVNGRALRIRARLANADGVLRPGLFARITVEGASRGRVVVVPEAAIVPRGGEIFVFRVADGKAEEVKVTLGQRRQGEVEVTDGLKDGDTVVVSGQSRLRSGGAVEVVGQAAAS